MYNLKGRLDYDGHTERMSNEGIKENSDSRNGRNKKKRKIME